MEKLPTVLKVLQTVNKFIVALIAAVTTLVVVQPDGVTAQEWVTVGVAFAGTLGVYAVPNKKS